VTEKTFYDDAFFDYFRYWEGREYEHYSEKIAITSLIGEIPFIRGTSLLDIGAGFGRLAEIYGHLFKKYVLLEPSRKLLTAAKRRLGAQRNLVFKRGKGERIPFSNASFDLVLLVRVIHHLKRPEKVIGEINRVLKPGGFLILEFANKIHFRAKMSAWLNGYGTLDLKPVDIRSPRNIRAKSVPFINYHPLWIRRMVEKQGFELRKKLSVSNFRLSLIKKMIPLKISLGLEKIVQPFLAKFDFGPSIFLLLRKTN